MISIATKSQIKLESLPVMLRSIHSSNFSKHLLIFFSYKQEKCFMPRNRSSMLISTTGVDFNIPFVQFENALANSICHKRWLSVSSSKLHSTQNSI